MKTPLSWIKEYVPDLDCTDEEYVQKMTMSGTKCEGYERLDKDLDKIVVGQILKIEKHPDADHLVICQVDIGDDTIQIVTGAQNVREGQKVPVVLVGGRVAGGHDGSKTDGGIVIKKGKLRGATSCGMMCSIEELGSSRDFYPEAPEDGIYVFNEDVAVGSDALEALGLRETVFEYEITSNRVDCYSVIGIAREASATFNNKFVLPKVETCDVGGDVDDYISVDVKDSELCPRYCARVVKNVKIAPSPKWMQRRLSACGIRPINNLVDITNYVMEEYGQPMHAYDLSTVADKKIVVRRANDKEVFRTLDGNDRVLSKDTLMICDGEKPIGIAGIMGGENSKITDDVCDVLFEAACFDGANIRVSAKKLGLRTDASGKFEKGLDPNNAMEAINRACELIEELGAGEVVSGAVDVYPVKREKRTIKFEKDKVNNLIGFDLKEEEMTKYFKPLGLSYDESAKVITVPTFRQDLVEMCDIAEEVARFYGYDNIPTTLPSKSAVGGMTKKLEIESIAEDVARYNGFSQGLMYSFESQKAFDRMMIDDDSLLRRSIEISNPIGEDFKVMRTTSVNGMLVSLATNYNRRNPNVRLYEMANVYLPKELPLQELPDERMQMTLGFYGDGDFYTMKGVVENILSQVGMRKKASYNPSIGISYLHPGRQAGIVYENETIGYLGEVHPNVCENYDIGTRAYIAVLDMPYIYEMADFSYKYTQLAKFPALTRDLSLVVPSNLPVGDIEKILEQRGGKILESYSLFDIYEGNQIEEGYKSVAYSLVFRASDRTLLDEDIAKAMKKILNGLAGIGVTIRS